MALIKENILTIWQEDTSKLKNKLLSILAKKSYIEGKIILSSGKESNYYVDGKQTTLDAEGIVLISILFLRLLKEDIKSVGGLTMGADPLSTGVSQISYLLGKKINAFYVRKESKKHGRSLWIEGPLEKGERVAILEDVVTTGSSSLKAIEKVIDFGCKVKQVLAIVDRNEGGRELFKQKGYDYQYLFDIKEVIERVK